MPTIYATIGLPGSGKSTYAEERCADDSGRRANRDDIRFALYGVYFGPPIDERRVTEQQDDLVALILASGRDVWIDDTNLSPVAREHCEQLAAYHKVPLEWVDFTHVPLETCVERDAARAAAGGRLVGEDVIRSMWDRWLKTTHEQESLPTRASRTGEV